MKLSDNLKISTAILHKFSNRILALLLVCLANLQQKKNVFDDKNDRQSVSFTKDHFHGTTRGLPVLVPLLNIGPTL